MSQTLLGVDGPIGWTDHYTTRRGVRGSNTIFKPDAIVAIDLSVPRFYKLTVKGGRAGLGRHSRPIVATGSFHAMWELWKHLGLSDGQMEEGSLPKKADYASISPVSGKGSNLFASRGGEHRENLLAADLVMTAGIEDVLDAWAELSRFGWKANIQVA